MTQLSAFRCRKTKTNSQPKSTSMTFKITMPCTNMTQVCFFNYLPKLGTLNTIVQELQKQSGKLFLTTVTEG